jgi:type II secretory pathway component GspD/PulD (secretin)
MTVVNRQSAVLMLDDPFGPAGCGNEFATGTIFKIRPVVDRSGIVQLDVRREVALDRPDSGSRAAALTNQIALHDGQTAVVGGFYAELTALQFYRPSGFGQLPLVGGLFRKQTEVVERCETIVLLTPHVIASSADADSEVVRKQQPSTGNADTGATVRASHVVPARVPRRGRK